MPNEFLNSILSTIKGNAAAPLIGAGVGAGGAGTLAYLKNYKTKEERQAAMQKALMMGGLLGGGAGLVGSRASKLFQGPPSFGEGPLGNLGGSLYALARAPSAFPGFSSMAAAAGTLGKHLVQTRTGGPKGLWTGQRALDDLLKGFEEQAAKGSRRFSALDPEVGAAIAHKVQNLRGNSKLVPQNVDRIAKLLNFDSATKGQAMTELTGGKGAAPAKLYDLISGTLDKKLKHLVRGDTVAQPTGGLLGSSPSITDDVKSFLNNWKTQRAAGDKFDSSALFEGLGNPKKIQDALGRVLDVQSRTMSRTAAKPMANWRLGQSNLGPLNPLATQHRIRNVLGLESLKHPLNIPKAIFGVGKIQGMPGLGRGGASPSVASQLLHNKPGIHPSYGRGVMGNMIGSAAVTYPTMLGLDQLMRMADPIVGGDPFRSYAESGVAR